MTFDDLPTDESVFPHRSGDFISIGPECFAAQDGSVLSWRGENYTPQRTSVRAWVNNNLRVPLIEAWRAVSGGSTP